MGIKFRCPNGHKLNVKSFLAGKRGVCPDCQATFRIPEEPGGSDVRAVALASLKGSNGSAGGQAAMEFEPAPLAAPAPAVVAATAPVVAVQAVPHTAVTPVATGIPLPASPAMMPTAVAAPGVMPVPSAPHPPVPPGAVAASDPIAEAPTAIWYVRPPSGGQYGPARGDVMRKWISEGRVSGDSLVWREGWIDWRNASQLFPSLAGGAGLGGGGVAAGPAVTTPQTARSTSRYAARKKSGSGMAIAALIGLVLVCVVLVAVLVVVLTQQAS